MIKVSLCEAIELCNKLYLQLERFGYFPALTGGQLYKTGGRKDIDIVIYRHRQKVANFEMKDIKSNLEEIGITDINFYGFVTKCKWKGFRVDLFNPESKVRARIL